MIFFFSFSLLLLTMGLMVDGRWFMVDVQWELAGNDRAIYIGYAYG